MIKETNISVCGELENVFIKVLIISNNIMHIISSLSSLKM